jgi:hypothetical protein
MTTPHRKAATAEPWDPRTISDDAWRRIGIEPATLGTAIAGAERADGFKRCGGHDNRVTFAVDVWSQVYPVDDFERKEAGAEFLPITITGRRGFHYHRVAETRSDRCHLIFPSIHGSYSIDVLKLDPRSPDDPCDRAVEVAMVMVRFLPS